MALTAIILPGTPVFAELRGSFSGRVGGIVILTEDTTTILAVPSEAVRQAEATDVRVGPGTDGSTVKVSFVSVPSACLSLRAPTSWNGAYGAWPSDPQERPSLRALMAVFGGEAEASEAEAPPTAQPASGALSSGWGVTTPGPQVSPFRLQEAGIDPGRLARLQALYQQPMASPAAGANLVDDANQWGDSADALFQPPPQPQAPQQANPFMGGPAPFSTTFPLGAAGPAHGPQAHLQWQHPVSPMGMPQMQPSGHGPPGNLMAGSSAPH